MRFKVNIFIWILFLLHGCTSPKAVTEVNEKLKIENYNLRINQHSLEEELAYCKLKYEDINQAFISEYFYFPVMECSSSFIMNNFSESCLLRIVTLTNDLSVLSKNIYSVKNSLVFVVRHGNNRIVYLYHPEGRNYYENIKNDHPESYIECEFKFSSDTPSSYSQKRRRNRIRNTIAGLEKNKIHYCEEGNIIFKIIDNLPEGSYIQISTIEVFDCRRFQYCNYIKSLLIIEDKSRGLYKVYVSGNEELLEQVKSCSDFRTAYLIKI